MASRDRCSPSLTDRLPDLRGFGWADAPRRGYSTGELVEDSLALLDALELERVWVIGDELGGRLGFHVSLCRPTAVRGHLALNALHPYWRARHLAPHAWRQWWTVFVETPLLGRTVLRRRPGLTRLLARLGHRCPRRGQRSRRSGTIQSAGSV
jgi:pimeloyl-ACP methyl ester carboxylesterase